MINRYHISLFTYSTKAIVLQYEGVVDLAGVTAALKLPPGFKAELPLTSDRYNYDIALSKKYYTI